uniref:Uncharacterized protein n=1 Tax=Anolis carolinensis TaxID=28377 RepID=A0A803SMM2_ANOCA
GRGALFWSILKRAKVTLGFTPPITSEPPNVLSLQNFSFSIGDSFPSPANVIQITKIIPCSKMRPISVKGSLGPTPPFLWKQQEQELQFWQGIHPSRKQIITIFQRALLVEQEKRLYTYNWNSLAYNMARGKQGRCDVMAQP